MKPIFTFLLLIHFISALNFGKANEWAPTYKMPEQIHLSFGANIHEYIVTWLTLSPITNKPTLQHGFERKLLDVSVSGWTENFTDQGHLKLVRFVHRVRLSDLKPDTYYYYRVGTHADGWSETLQFKTLPEEKNWISPTILIFGDLGNGNDRTLGLLQEEINSETVDFAIHLGDFAYNLEHIDGKVGDAFFQEIQPLASFRPYQVMPGNHEDAYNYSAYDARFSMYSQGSTEKNNFWWSYDWGRAHFVFFTNEFYYTQQYGTSIIHNQLRWLEEDLKKANDARESSDVKWIIVLSHRPLYDNFHLDNTIRRGTPQLPGFEHLFWKYGVDLEFYAHNHIYERMWPVYNRKVYKGTTNASNPYENPGAPVHITSGSAGCALPPDLLNSNPPDYSAFQSRDYTYSKLTIEPNTLRFVTFSQDQNKVIDEMVLYKDKFGPYEL